MSANNNHGVNAGRKIKGVKASKPTAPKTVHSKRDVKNVEFGVSIASKANVEFLQKAADGLHKINETLESKIEPIKEGISVIADDLNDREAAEKYHLSLSKTFADLKEGRNESIFLCTVLCWLLQVCTKNGIANDLQRNYYVNLCRYLSVSDKTASDSAEDFDINTLRTIDSNSDKKLIALASFTLLFLAYKSFDFKDDFKEFITELHLRKDEDEDICRYISDCYERLGAENLISLLPTDEEDSEDFADNNEESCDGNTAEPIDYDGISALVKSYTDTGKLGKPILKGLSSPLKTATDKAYEVINKSTMFASDLYLKKKMGEGLGNTDEAIERNSTIAGVVIDYDLDVLGNRVIEITKLHKGYLVFTFSSIYYLNDFEDDIKLKEIWLPNLRLDSIRSDREHVVVDMEEYEVEIRDKKVNSGELSNLLSELCGIGNFEQYNNIRYLSDMSDAEKIKFINLTATLCKECGCDDMTSLITYAADLDVLDIMECFSLVDIEDYNLRFTDIDDKLLMFFALIAAIINIQNDRKSNILTEKEKSILSSALKGTFFEATDENLETIIDFAQLEHNIIDGNITTESEICRISRAFHNMVNRVSFNMEKYISFLPLLVLTYYTARMEINYFKKAVVVNPYLTMGSIAAMKNNHECMKMLPIKLIEAERKMIEYASSTIEKIEEADEKQSHADDNT